MSRFRAYCGIVLLGLGATVAVGQKGGKSTALNTATKPANRTALTPAREAAAITFVKLHHPELATLLQRLKKRRNKSAYNRAMRQIYQDSERLARMKERMPGERYELQLRLWKLDSRIRLLAARVYRGKRVNQKLKKQLDAALLERVDLRVEQMQQDRRRLVERLGKLDASIDSLKKDREKAAGQQLTRVKRSLGIRKPRKNRKVVKRRPAGNTQPTKTEK